MNPKKQKNVKGNLEQNDTQNLNQVNLVDQLGLFADIIIDIYFESEIDKEPK